MPSCAPRRNGYGRAFIDPAALVKWLPPHGFTGTMHEMDARAGGGYRMSFANLGSGKSHAFQARYVELLPGRLIRHTDRFEDSGLPGEMQVEIRLGAGLCTTALHSVQTGIPELIPLTSCHLGWQESLALLAQLVEPEILTVPEPSWLSCAAEGPLVSRPST